MIVCDNGQVCLVDPEELLRFCKETHKEIENSVRAFRMSVVRGDKAVEITAPIRETR